MEKNYVVVDLETTGLDPKKDKIIEIGAVKVRGGEVADTFEKLIYPGRKLSQKIVELTGITDEMLAGKPLIGDVIPEFLAFAGEDILIGHCVLFDYSFLKRAVVNYGENYERQGIDMLKISRELLPDLESRSLSFLCGHYGIEYSPHRALPDARATHELYQRLCKEFPKATLEAPRDLLYAVKKEGPITPKQKERLQKLLSLYGVEPDYDIDLLTKNEASRMMDLLMLEFGRPGTGLVKEF